MHRRRFHLTSTIDAKTLVIINEVVDETKLTVGRVLNVIVQEWFGTKEMKPLSTKNQSRLKKLEDLIQYQILKTLPRR